MKSSYKLKNKKKSIKRKSIKKKSIKRKRVRNTRRKKLRNAKSNKKGGSPTSIEINSIYLAHRVLLIANIESNNAINKDINYTPIYDSGKYTKEPLNYPVNQSFAFEYSTGTSNIGENFPTTFLPIMYIDGVGRYLNKARGLDEDIGEYIIETIILPYIIEECKNNAREHLLYFLKRFGCWKQLQISAAIGGEAWDTYKHLTLLQRFAFTHDCIYDIQGLTFIERINPIQPVDLNASVPIVGGNNAPLSQILNYNNDGILINNFEINSWLHYYNVISSEKLSQLSQQPSSSSDNNVVEEQSFNGYKIKLFKSSSLDDFLGKIIEFPPELMDYYINKKDYINPTKGNIPYNKIKNLYDDVQIANNNNLKFYQDYITDLNSVTDSELRKYIPFLIFTRNNKSYESKGFPMSQINITKALQTIKKRYPEYELNKFNWRICS